jgi:hypothetical protein
MTVRIGDMTFSDWVSLPFEDGWTDTFIFRISAQACIPPFEYAPLLKRIVAHTRRKRRTASIWVQVNAPGEWYLSEVRKALEGLKLPHAVTTGSEPGYLDFPWRPWLGHEKSKHPPVVEEKLPLVSLEELRCLQALGRIETGNEHEIASLAGLSVDETATLLSSLEEKKLVGYKESSERVDNTSRPAWINKFRLWNHTSRGLSIALRSWGAPRGTEFTSRLEEDLPQTGTVHRHVSRVWPAWLKIAWPQAEIWAGWSEVRLPETDVIPDGLAWGRIQGYETLFWLEVGDGHKSREQIIRITQTRLRHALKFCKRTGVRLVYAQLSMKWVQETARWGLTNLPPEVAVVMGDQRKFGRLPSVEWGKITAQLKM